MELFCDMTTDDGGWSLVWSYTFTNYNQFDDNSNAVTPVPTWPATNVNVNRSTTPPTHEYSLGALEFGLWKSIGKEFLIKSNINNWIACSPNTGSLVDWATGFIRCRNLKNIGPAQCNGKVPEKVNIFAIGPRLRRDEDRSMTYHFEGSTDSDWPVHDPCGSNSLNQKTGVELPGGNVYIR